MKFLVEIDDQELEKDAKADTVQKQADLIRRCLEDKFMTVKVKTEDGTESNSRSWMRIREPHRGRVFNLVFGE